MTDLMRRRGESWLPGPIDEWGRHALGMRRERRDSSTGLIVAGVVALGLGYLAWAYLAPDLRRYLKIHSM